MKKMTTVAAVLATLLCATSASATEVLSYTFTALIGSDPTQMGRLTRARPPSDWSTAPTPFPGFINLNVPYQYTTVAAPFAPNALQDVYYEVTVDDPDALIFASAYDSAYDPGAPSVGYLGDEGSSGNYFPGDPSFFQVVVPKGGSLTLAFNSVGLANGPFAYQVSAFSDTQYNEDFKTSSGVPEPSTWALLLLGFGFVGCGLRGARHGRRQPAQAR